MLLCKYCKQNVLNDMLKTALIIVKFINNNIFEEKKIQTSL